MWKRITRTVLQVRVIKNSLTGWCFISFVVIGYSDGASSSGAMTLPRSVNHEFDNDNHGSHITNSLDKRSYIPGYMSKEFEFARSECDS